MTNERLRMSDHFDSLETRDPAARENDLFARLPAQIARAMTAPGWAKHLAGVDPKSVTSRAALAKLPVLRKSALLGLQKETPPFGGFNATSRPARRSGCSCRPGRSSSPKGHGDDPAVRRARCSRPASAPATSCTTASRITSRPARSSWKPARMRSAAR